MDIAHILVERVREGNVVLFLGSGAAKGALHAEGKSPPDGQQLADLVALKFLGNEYLRRPLDQVAALAISETDLITVQNFVSDIFSGFSPAEFHKIIPTFAWSAIATTNYDLIIERAYSDSSDSAKQRLEPFLKNSQHVEDKIRDPAAVMYLKLHGCVSMINDPDTPLILTPEQYITHRRGRSRLFDKLISLAHEHPMLFVGYSLSDIDLRMILYELGSLGASMPRSFLVAPNITAADDRYWGSRRMTCVRGTFEEFLGTLRALV